MLTSATQLPNIPWMGASSDTLNSDLILVCWCLFKAKAYKLGPKCIAIIQPLKLTASQLAMLIAGLGKWVMPYSTLKSKKAYMYYLVEGSAEERCLVLAVNWPALVAGGLTGAAAAAAASAVAVVGMPAAYSLMAAGRQKEKIKTHYFQPCSTGLPGFSRVLHKQPNPSFSLACSQHSSQSWSLVLSGHTAYNEEPLIYHRNRMKGGERACLAEHWKCWVSLSDEDIHKVCAFELWEIQNASFSALLTLTITSQEKLFRIRSKSKTVFLLTTA